MINTSGAGGDGNEPNYERSADRKEGISAPTISMSGAGGDGDEPDNDSSTSEDGDDDEDEDMPSLASESDEEDDWSNRRAFQIVFSDNEINIRRNGPEEAQPALHEGTQHLSDEAMAE